MKTRRLAIPLVTVSILTVAIACAIAFWPTPRRAALARIEELAGTYAEQEVDEGSGKRRVVSIMVVGRPVTDDDLALFSKIRPLHRIMVDKTNVTDAGLAHLEGIDELELVSVCHTEVTDAGLTHLEHLPNLRMLSVRHTHVTDSGLSHLLGLNRLESLNVLETSITDGAIDNLRTALPNLKYVFLHLSDD
jgi:DNA-binding transcriptional LysR family regulator